MNTSQLRELADQLDEARFDIHHSAKECMKLSAAELRRLASVEQAYEALKDANDDLMLVYQKGFADGKSARKEPT